MMFRIRRADVELKSIEQLTGQQVLTVMSESKALANKTQLWSPTHAIQTKIAEALLSRQIHRMFEELVGKPLPLPFWEHRKLVQIGRRCIRYLRPKAGSCIWSRNKPTA